MKVTQIIILLAAFLAIVAFGIASAGGGLGRLFGKNKEPEEPKEPCIQLKTNEACDICCRKNGHVSGRYSLHYYAGSFAEELCKCADKETWGVFGYELPEWRKREQAQKEQAQMDHSAKQSF